MIRKRQLFWLTAGLGLGLLARELVLNRQNVTRTAGPLLWDWLAGKKTVDDLATELAVSTQKARQQLMQLTPTETNYKVLNHIIGIERWGQQRLNVMLGEPLVEDSYDGHRPALDLSWNELQDLFATTRAETARVIEQIAALGPESRPLRVLHNDWGDLSLEGWLTYLRLHAEIESRKMS